jgi:putative tryptophan/tyrosine transport system substrate-binding protein
LVASLPRPGGNLTGLTLAVVELSGKRPEILKEALPDLRRVAMLTDPGFGQNARGLAETQAAAKRLGLQVQPVEVREPSELDMGFLAARRSRADGVVVQSHSLYFVHRRRIADLAIGYRLPTIFSQREHIDVGA